MTKQQVLDEIMKHHDAKLKDVEGDMCSMIWFDGEHVSTKCGSLFGQRNWHVLAHGLAKVELQSFLKDKLPISGLSPAGNCAFVPYEEAHRLSQLINNWQAPRVKIVNPGSAIHNQEGEVVDGDAIKGFAVLLDEDKAKGPTAAIYCMPSETVFLKD